MSANGQEKLAPPRAVAITGAAGFVGRATLAALAADRRTVERIVAIDVREVPPAERLEGVVYETADVRAPGLADLLARHGADAVVHLASIVTPRPGESRAFAYSVDVLGTRNVLEACAAAGVPHLVVTSSGAAYGFHADNPEWLREAHPLRGNDAFAYARHKRLVEEMLAEWRARRPDLRQLVFRPGTILGRGVRNQITDLFEKPAILAVRGAASPFVFIWDEDVARCIVLGLHGRREGIFNLAGDGALTLREIAARTGKPLLRLPAWLLGGAIRALRAVGLTQYGPEQVDFIRYRSVLMNDALKDGFGYAPRYASSEAFDLYWASRAGA
jgi:UDP-glucose 4-epimerase